jgi:hypothetical protein
MEQLGTGRCIWHDLPRHHDSLYITTGLHVFSTAQAIFGLSPETDSTPPSDDSDSDSGSDSDDDEDERAQRSLRKQIMALPDSRYALADAMDKKLRGLLDSVIEVPLPGISRQHDLLFLQRLLRQLSGVDIDQNTPRPAWMALVRAQYSLQAQPTGAALAFVHI